MPSSDDLQVTPNFRLYRNGELVRLAPSIAAYLCRVLPQLIGYRTVNRHRCATAAPCLQVDQLSGINETNLRNAVEKALHPEQSREQEEAA
jgi:hypothetical protein